MSTDVDSSFPRFNELFFNQSDRIAKPVVSLQTKSIYIQKRHLSNKTTCIHQVSGRVPGGGPYQIKRWGCPSVADDLTVSYTYTVSSVKGYYYFICIYG